MNPVEEWFDPIYDANFNRLLNLARNMLVVDLELAEDMVQRTFLVLLVKREQVQNHPNITGWLIKTLSNIIDNEENRAKYKREVPLFPDCDFADNMVENFQEHLPQGLTEEERRLLVLHVECGYSLKDIAKDEGIHPAACRMRWRRARIHCRKLLME